MLYLFPEIIICYEQIGIAVIKATDNKLKMIITASDKDIFVPENSRGEYLTSSFAESHPLNILVAEDNIINQKLIERILRKLGYHTDIVSDGIQALNSIEKQEYNVILMDVRMPLMDGYEATRTIRKMTVEQPYIIAMTANAMANDKIECIQNGMNDYVSKPLSTVEIMNSLKNGYTFLTHKKNNVD